MTPQEFIDKRKQLMRIKTLPSFLDELIEKQKSSHREWLDSNGDVVYPTIYKSVDLKRNIFSKMRSSVNYHPEKYNVCKIAFALGLNLEETNELLSVCGYVFSPSVKFDIIVASFIEAGVYDVEMLDEVLYQENQRTFMGCED